MNSNSNVLGLIFSNMHDGAVSELTKRKNNRLNPIWRKIPSYRLPTFKYGELGNFEVGVITKSNYQSLLDHLGSGREWDLARKHGGLHLLPPFSHVGSGIYRGRLEALAGVWPFLQTTSAEYVVLSDCDVVTNIDYRKVIKAHKNTGADITVVYGNGIFTMEETRHCSVLGINEDNRIYDMLVSPEMSGSCNISLNMFVMSKAFLLNIIKESSARNLYSFEKDILQARLHDYKIYGYNHEGYFSKISSMNTYYQANMELLDTESRKALFLPNSPIYTKIRDNPPAKFDIGASAKNSLIADGCIIEGTVENSVLFRGVKIGKGAVVKNCILMQDTSVGSKCEISNVITDKNVTIGKDRLLTGSQFYPLYIGKGATI